MLQRGLSHRVIQDFLAYVALVRKESGYVPLHSVGIPDPTLLLDYPAGLGNARHAGSDTGRLLNRAALIKLNGGRSTTMGGTVPKGILKAKRGLSYLEVVVTQVKAVQERWDCHVPLILMNSFYTDQPTKELIRDLDCDVRTFVQNEVPRLVEKTLIPLDTGTEEDWVPPGHGDVYRSLLSSGMLEELRAGGYKWAFISNIDNLAASMDPAILGLIEEQDADFLMEVTPRTEADRKGGALVVRNGRLELLEIAQVDPDQRPEFMDIDRFPVFNTNNIWVDLDALAELLADVSLSLPLIQNRKRIKDTDVLQLETAMGAAIGNFRRAKGLKVSRARFCPTKDIGDLFAVRSDACLLDGMGHLVRNPKRPASLPFLPAVHFGDDFLSSPQRINERFEDPASVSLLYAEVFKVFGHVFFERDVTIQGKVEICVPPGQKYCVPRGAVLADRRYP